MQIIEMLEAKAEGEEAHRGLIVANDADYRRAHLTTSPYYIPLLHPLTTTMPTTGEPICWWRVRRGCVAHSSW